MIKTVVEMALTDHSPEMMVALRPEITPTSTVELGFIKRGKDADIMIVDALGSSGKTALDAIVPVTIRRSRRCSDGIWFIHRSRNTPPSTRKMRLKRNTMLQEFDQGGTRFDNRVGAT